MRIRNLQKRSNGVFYFRTFIPTDLIPRFGRKELTRSLDTRNRAEGEFLASILRLKIRALFDMARQNPNLSQAELQALAKRYFDWHLEQAEADRLKRRIKEGQLPFALEQYDENIENLDSWIANNQLTQATPALTDLLRREGLYLAPESAEYQKLASYVLRAMRESERIERQRASGNFDALPADPLFKVAPVTENQASAPAASPLFSDLAARWLSERKAMWADKTVVKHTSNINVWQELIGRDKPVAMITKADVRTARDELRKLPRNWTQKFPGKSITDVLASASPGDGPLIEPGTVNAYLMTLSSFFGWAEKEGYVTGNPVSNLQVDDPVKARDKRDPFKSEHLVKIFNAPVYTGMKSDYKWMTPGNVFKRDHRFWIPLIGLLSGMRLGEIANLTKEDVCSEAGIVVFDIKKAKTESGIRKVPVHSKLIEIGLVDFVANTAAGAKLFPGTSDAAFSKVFARLLDHLGIKDSKLTFHSFRHTFIDSLRSAKIEQPIIQAVVGQSTGTVTSQYGAGYPVSVLRDAVEAVTFPGFDLYAFGVGRRWGGFLLGMPQ